MSRYLLLKTFFYVLLWFCTAASVAQTPVSDLDSITEDSYRRMLERQEAEQHLDSLRLNQSRLEVTKSNLKDKKKYYYAAAGLITIGLCGVFWYYRQHSKTNKNFKN